MTLQKTWRGASANLAGPAFPTRRAVVGGALAAAATWFLSYRPTPDPPWTRLTDKALWPPRDGAALLAHNDRLWLLGGSAKDQEPDLADSWSSVDGIDWRKEIDQTGWTPSAQSMGATFAGRMWRMGGFVEKENQVRAIREIWSSLDGRTWSLATGNPAWTARGGGALVVHDGKLWLLGGTQHPQNARDQAAFGDVWSTENGVDWTEVVPNAAWRPRAFHSATAHGSRLWVMGGSHWSKKPTLYRDVWSSSDGIQWEEHSNAAAWPGRIWATAASYDGLLWIMGGFLGKPRGGTKDIWYSVDGSDWYPYLPAKAWPARIAHCSIVFNDRLWVLAGSNGDHFNDVWALKIRENDSPQGSSRMIRGLYRILTP